MPDCAAATALCRYLEWDSEFFRLRIGRAEPERLTAKSVKQILNWCDSERIDCLYFLAGSADAQSIEVAENAGFHLVDLRITLSKDMSGTKLDYQTPAVRPFRAEDIPGLRQIARVSHRDSRFYYDGNFPRERCDALYETWIEKSTQGYAQAVLVAEFDGAAAGYISCHLNAGSGQIGLFAVAERAQARGLGSQLVLAAFAWFRAQNVERVTVVTQGRNIPGQRLYQKCGFSTHSLQLWYHYWRHRTAEPT